MEQPGLMLRGGKHRESTALTSAYLQNSAKTGKNLLQGSSWDGDPPRVGGSLILLLPEEPALEDGLRGSSTLTYIKQEGVSASKYQHPGDGHRLWEQQMWVGNMASWPLLQPQPQHISQLIRMNLPVRNSISFAPQAR